MSFNRKFMKKKSKINNDNSDIRILHDLLIIAYKKIKKKNLRKYENVILILFHELMYFFSTLIINKKIKNFNQPINKLLINKNLKFGKRNNKSIIKKKKRRKINLIIIKIINTTLLCFYKKKIIFGNSISINFFGKLKVITYAILFGYKIEFSNFQKVFIPKINFQKKIINQFLEIIEKKTKIKINDNIKKDINLFIKRISLKKKELQIFNKKNIYLLGSTANIYNRLNAINGLQESSNVYVFGHDKQTGIIDSLVNKYDDYCLCTHYVGFAKKKFFKKIKYKSYSDIDDIEPKYIENKNFSKNKIVIKPIYFNSEIISKKRGLYIPRKFSNYLSLTPRELLNYEKYLDWQNFLINNIDKLDYKMHPKDKLSLEQLKNIVSFSPKKIKVGSLENIIKNYDYLVIDYVSTTAFSDIAKSEKPILYFDLDLDRLTSVGIKVVTDRALKVKINQESTKNYFNVNSIRKLGKFTHSNKRLLNYIK